MATGAISKLRHVGQIMCNYDRRLLSLIVAVASVVWAEGCSGARRNIIISVKQSWDMGCYRCSVAGCTSRWKRGILFRKYPRNPDLAKLWENQLPAGFVITDRTYICERHFDANQFEKVRQDGKKKFKESAVPTVLSPTNSVKTPVRMPFQEVTNLVNTVSGPLSEVISPHTCTYVKENASQRRKSDHTYGKPHYIKIHPDLVPPGVPPQCDSSCSPGQISDVSVHSVELAEEDAVNALLMLSATLEGDSVVVTSPSASVATKPCSNHDNKQKEDGSPTDHLSNSSKSHVPSNLADGCSNKEMQLPSPNSLPICDDDLIIQPENEVVGYLMKLVADQKRDITRLQAEADAKANLEEKYDALLQTVKSYAATNDKLQAQKQANRKLRQDLERERRSYSPWLHKTQQRLIKRHSPKGIKWDSALIRQGLVLKMKCGTSGYSAFVQQIPLLPSVRSLQQAVQFVRFESGLLHEVFDILQVVVKDFPDMYTDCELVLDEMAIEKSERYDHSTKTFVGRSTFPTHTGIATKALVFMLAGISYRWKIAVAVYLTNQKSEGDESENSTGEAYKCILNSVIVKAESIGLKVCAITSDMGPDNLAFWRAYGVTGGRNQLINSSFPNPARDGAKINIIPDPPHHFKALKTMLESNGVVVLPAQIVEEEGLPSAQVNYKHIESLYEFEEQFELKVAFRLKKFNLHCNKQFKKMNMGTHRAVLCHRTSVGISLLSEFVDSNLSPSYASYTTTAWFIEQINTFFELVTNRSKTLALSKANNEVYEKAIALIKKMSYIFQHMRVGEKGAWKPCQRGMVVLCNSILELQDYFLNTRGYRYLMLGRFTQDCLENLFSCIRLSQPVPHAVAFFQNLKVVTLAQVSEAVKGSSYDFDNDKSLPDILTGARERAEARQEAKIIQGEELAALQERNLNENDFQTIPTWEQCVLYDMAGSVIKSIKLSNVEVCPVCIDAVMWHGNKPHPRSTVATAKEFAQLRSEESKKNLLQIYVSDEVFKAVMTAEATFRMYRAKTLNFKNCDVEKFYVSSLMYVWDGTQIPNCHGICQKILQFYIRKRLRQYGKTRREELQTESGRKNRVTERSSKSMAMRASANDMNVAKGLLRC